MHFEVKFVWAIMVQAHRVKKKSFFIMNVMFSSLSRVSEVTMKYITFMINKKKAYSLIVTHTC